MENPNRTEIALRMLAIITHASNPRQPAVSVSALEHAIRAADKLIELLQTEKPKEHEIQ